jgi:tRNA threonylcarbamoyladenosine biosynthesis protein TsaE
MQEATKFPLDISFIAREDELKYHLFSLSPWARIFFSGDLWSWKTTFIRDLLRSHFDEHDIIVRSPTYTYFQKYGKDIYHFDLYRLSSIEDFFLIWGDDILSNPETICLIEWPEILKWTYFPTLKVALEKISETERKITLTHEQSSTD